MHPIYQKEKCKQDLVEGVWKNSQREMGITWFACDQISPGSSEQEQYVRFRIFKCFVMVSHVVGRVLREG